MSEFGAAGARPFGALRVLDLTGGLGPGISGGYASKLLTDVGAEVVKLEASEGDPLRRFTASGVELPEGEDAAFFRFLHASQRSVVADLESEAGREFALALAATSDLVLENFGPGGLEARGLSVAALQERNPALSVVSLSPFGLEGPWADRPATEFTLQAAVGSIAYRGLPERGPVCAGGQLGDFCLGTYAALGALVAVVAARRSGKGQHVDVSHFESILIPMTVYHDLDGQFFEGPLAQALETPSIEPARDGWVGMATYTGQQWKDFCALIGRPDVGEDDRFYEGRVRMDHLEFIQSVIHAWTREQSVDEAIELLSAMRIPCAPIGDGRNVLERDHFRERGVFVDNPHGFKQPRTPYLLEEGEQRGPGRAPALGADTEALRRELETRRPMLGAAEQGDAAPELPLDGLRIVDLTAFWAGPITTSTLAALGADVIKVESIQRPDGMRFAGAVRNETMWEWAPVAHGANPGKRGITLNLEDERGMAILERLIASADVLCENFSVRVMDQFGLTPEKLRALNPRLITVRMPGWGLDGPWRDRTGFAPNVEQASGLAWMTGYDDMPLVIRGACDPIGGMHAAIALFCALERRRVTGKGQLVEVPLIEPALNLAAQQVIEWSAYGRLLERNENRGPLAAPQGVYPSRHEGDRDPMHVAIAVRTDEEWQALRAVVGAHDWSEDPAHVTAEGRRAGHDRIDAGLAAWCAQRSAGEVARALGEAGIPAAELVNAHYLMPNPQLEARSFFETLEHPVTGKTRYPGLPMRFSSLRAELHRRPPPTLGQHNEEVLCRELGLTRDEVEALAEAKVIGTRPSFM